MKAMPSPESTLAPLPYPPFEMRELVGITDLSYYDNPTASPIFGDNVEIDLYENVLDFGCGCGRLARQLIQQVPRPRTYLGLDLHKGMVRWDQENLAPAAKEFEFRHHDVYHIGFNPSATSPRTAEFPVGDRSISLVIAHSVFTHLVQDQCEHYLREVARVLRPGGMMYSTWFLFDKSVFPMMQEFQNTLYINEIDLTNATIFDAKWLIGVSSDLGLIVRAAKVPLIRGDARRIYFRRSRPGEVGAELPVDNAPIGRSPPPLGPANPSTVGLRGPTAHESAPSDGTLAG
jgi:SAM-dependent methyltransferase